MRDLLAKFRLTLPPEMSAASFELAAAHSVTTKEPQTVEIDCDIRLAIDASIKGRRPEPPGPTPFKFNRLQLRRLVDRIAYEREAGVCAALSPARRCRPRAGACVIASAARAVEQTIIGSREIASKPGGSSDFAQSRSEVKGGVEIQPRRPGATSRTAPWARASMPGAVLRSLASVVPWIAQ